MGEEFVDFEGEKGRISILGIQKVCGGWW